MKEQNRQLTLGRSWINRFMSNMLMIMVLLVVLSTATFAWYSVANVATADDVTFYAASEQEGGDLCISWQSGGSDYNLSFASVSEENGLYPMIPTVEGIVDATAYENFLAFNKATETYDELGQLITRLSSDYETQPYVLQNTDGQKEFYIINKGSSDLSITLSYSITGQTYAAGSDGETAEYEIVNKFRCAFFTSGGETGSSVLRGIMSNESAIHYGTLTDNQSISDTPVMTDGYRATQRITFTVPKTSYVKAYAVGWFDGVDMKDEDGSGHVSLVMAFSGAVITG